MLHHVPTAVVDGGHMPIGRELRNLSAQICTMMVMARHMAAGIGFAALSLMISVGRFGNDLTKPDMLVIQRSARRMLYRINGLAQLRTCEDKRERHTEHGEGMYQIRRKHGPHKDTIPSPQSMCNWNDQVVDVAEAYISSRRDVSPPTKRSVAGHNEGSETCCLLIEVIGPRDSPDLVD